MIQLFIATTLDGFIARENGSIDWLLELPNPSNTDHGYNDFIKDVDIIVMGRKTYDDLLGYGGEWPYGDRITYVVTKNQDYKPKTANTFILRNIDLTTISQVRTESKKNIWIAGGGEIITQFMNENAIDEMTISIIPLILGKGIRLFGGLLHETEFDFLKAESFETGVVNLIYKRKR
jgi:dihydrofolate reductase